MKKNKTYILITILLVGGIMLYFLTRKTKKPYTSIPVKEDGLPYSISQVPVKTQETYLPISNDHPIKLAKAQGQMPSNAAGCISPTFNNKFDYSGRSCAGELINENIVLKLGDQGCEVLLLQQRLNSIETERDILSPTGKFCCATQSKLMRLMSLPRFALNQFSPDEQIGFNSLQAGKKIIPYSYMDTKTFNK